MNLMRGADGSLPPSIELPPGKFDLGLIKESLTERIAPPPIHPLSTSAPRFTLAEARAGLVHAHVSRGDPRARACIFMRPVYACVRVCVCGARHAKRMIEHH